MPICKNDVHCQQNEGDIVAKEKKIEKEEKEEKEDQGEGVRPKISRIIHKYC